MLKYKNYWLLIAVFLSFFAALSLAPLFDLDEGAFSEATREMLKNGNYITTYLNGELRFDKPIFIYWLQALSANIFGLNEFALRLPSAIASMFWAFGIYWFGKKYFQKKTAFLASFFMISSLQITIIAKAAIADALLNMCIAYSMFFIYIYIDKREKKFLYFAFAAIAIGTLTKGPVAILIPLAVSFLYLLLKKELKFYLKTIFNPTGIFIFLAIALPWYVLEYMDQGMKFIDGFILKHNVSRFETSFEGHSGTIFYYIPVILAGMMPYTSLLLKAILKIKTWFKDDLQLFLSLWFLFVFLLFSLSGTKLPHYVIYGYTPIFYLMALKLEDIKSDFLYVLPTLILFLILLFLPEIALTSLPYIKNDFTKDIILDAPQYFNIFYRVFFILAIIALVFLGINKKFDKITKSVILGLITIIAINFFVLPTYGKIAQKPIKEAAQIAKNNNYKVVMYKINKPSFIFYSKKLVQRRDPKPGEIVLTKTTALKDFKNYKILYKSNGILLIKVKK